MSLDDGDLITTTDDPHAQLRHQPDDHRTTDNYTYAVYVRYPHTPPKHILDNNKEAFKQRLPADDTLEAFEKGWVYYSGHKNEDHARNKMDSITPHDAAHRFENTVADVLVNKGFQLRE